MSLLSFKLKHFPTPYLPHNYNPTRNKLCKFLGSFTKFHFLPNFQRTGAYKKNVCILHKNIINFDPEFCIKFFNYIMPCEQASFDTLYSPPCILNLTCLVSFGITLKILRFHFCILKVNFFNYCITLLRPRVL